MKKRTCLSLKDASFPVVRVKILVVFFPKRIVFRQFWPTVFGNSRQKSAVFQILTLIKQKISGIKVDVVHADFATTGVVEAIPLFAATVLSVRNVVSTA